MTSEIHNYSISIREVDAEDATLFEARVKELPDVVEYADSFKEAYELALDSIETTTAYFKEMGKEMPLPIAPVDDYSGRITLRMGKGLHRVVAEAASAENISLNQFLIGVIAFHSGFGYCARHLPLENWISLGETISANQRKPRRRQHLRLIHSTERKESTAAVN